MAIHPLLPGHHRITVFRDSDLYVVQSKSETFYFPSDLHMSELFHMAMGYADWLGHKYQYGDIVNVESGDVVFDCGAFVGAFSLYASGIASRVVTIEPAPQTQACLRKNLGGLDNVEIVQALLYHESIEVDFQLSDNPVDHSVLTPDHGATGETITMKTQRLSTLASSLGINRIDFLKIDAEGAEPEVLYGAEGLDIKKVAVDCGPEREGDSPLDEVRDYFEQLGFETYTRGYMLYGRVE